MKTFFYIFLVVLFTKEPLFGQNSAYKIHTIAFYNLENLFDTIHNPTTSDEDWTPEGTHKWNNKKYQQKLHNLSKVLAQIGTDTNKNAPTIIGCCEIENLEVLQNLIATPKLKPYDYGIVHYNSPDKRGIDVAFLFQKKYFTPQHFQNIPLVIYGDKKIENKKEEILAEDFEEEEKAETNQRIYTRDQLLVTGFLEDEEISFIINHWPSRSGGEKKSNPYREAAAKLNTQIIDSLQNNKQNAKIITMGDFNDSPFNSSIKKILQAKASKNQTPAFGFFNPFEQMAKNGQGTIAFRDAWDVFDQIILSKTLIDDSFNGFQLYKAGIFKQAFLQQTQGKYKGYPKRHSLTEVGYSDHFPVYIYLIQQKK